ncbi:IS110 family transposase [Limnoglobus roseus]|uniref:IS110 family transposase n=1 Tax=Limnoglobus roseus TaxID=2598579 RepID=A0A5C1ARA9_9BACT|nr:IS110 family transposase [Limnoglobus roseus]
MNTILAIDLSKYNSVSCHYDPATKATRFRTFRTTPDELRKVLGREPVAVVVIEACSGAGWVTDVCQSLGLAVAVANTAGEAWKWQNVKRKTDRDDTLKLARLAAMGELPTVPMLPKAIREWKSLRGLRKRLLGERVRAQNRVRALPVAQGLTAPPGRGRGRRSACRGWTRWRSRWRNARPGSCGGANCHRCSNGIGSWSNNSPPSRRSSTRSAGPTRGWSYWKRSPASARGRPRSSPATWATRNASARPTR